MFDVARTTVSLIAFASLTMFVRFGMLTKETFHPLIPQFGSYILSRPLFFAARSKLALLDAQVK